MRITVVIPTLNRKALLLRTLEALLEQDYPPFEILVVDNGSVDGTREAAASLGSGLIRVLREEARGPAAARNNGVGEAAGDIIAFVDDDAVPAPDWTARIAAFFASEPLAAGVGGPSLAEWHGGAPPAYISGSKKLQSYLGVFDLGPEKKRLRGFYEFLIGTNCAFRRDVFGRGARFMHIRLGRPGTCEDLEFSRRIAAQYPVYYCPDIKVRHFIASYKYSFRYILALVFDCGLKKPCIKRRLSPRGARDVWGMDGVLSLFSFLGYICGSIRLLLDGRLRAELAAVKK